MDLSEISDRLQIEVLLIRYTRAIDTLASHAASCRSAAATTRSRSRFGNRAHGPLTHRSRRTKLRAATTPGGPELLTRSDPGRPP